VSIVYSVDYQGI